MRSPYAIHRPVENAYLVRERDRLLLRDLLAVAAAVLVLGGGLLAYTWMHVEILATGYRIDSLEKKLHELLEEERQWRLQSAWLAHPQRLEERAREELEMIRPSLDETLYYEELVDASTLEGGRP